MSQKFKLVFFIVVMFMLIQSVRLTQVKRSSQLEKLVLTSKSSRDPHTTELFYSYGVYCGLKHGNDFGVKPIDSIDRICQIHDICVSALGYTSCACNEQLYAYATLVYVTTPLQIAMRDYILSDIYTAILPCSDYNGLGKYYFINRKFPGQNYMPFFPYNTRSKYVQITYNSHFSFYLVNSNNYKQFTKDVFSGNEQLSNAKFVFIYSSSLLVEIPQDKVLVAVTHYLDGDNAVALEVIEIDTTTSFYITMIKQNKLVYLDVVSSVGGTIIVILLIVLIVFVVRVYRKKNVQNEYKIQQNDELSL